MIQDFGEKIGGACKDRWKGRGLSYADTLDMTSTEKEKFIKRDQIWGRLNTKQMLAEGCDRYTVYWQSQVQKAIYPNMKHMRNQGEEGVQQYIDAVSRVRDLAMSMHSKREIEDFAGTKAYDEFTTHAYGTHYYFNTPYQGVLKTGKTFLRLIDLVGIDILEREMNQKGFGMSQKETLEQEYEIVCLDGVEYHIKRDSHDKPYVARMMQGGIIACYYPVKDMVTLQMHQFLLLCGNDVLYCGTKELCEKERDQLIEKLLSTSKVSSKKNRKHKWMPPELEHLTRSGTDYRKGQKVSGNDFMKAFGIRAGEFGNWTNEQNRQENLNLCFDAFLDLADALKISRTDISLPGLETGGLAIAFGARGRGSALAHYEPEREVINLTKMKGAGSLAHEWGHALDDMVAKRYHLRGLATMQPSSTMPKVFKEIVRVMNYKENGTSTQYAIDSKKFDGIVAKDGKGYWSSNCEMFARAFACYIMDRLKGRNDYLCGHANLCKMSVEEEMIYAYPRGEERERINQSMDRFMDKLKEMEYFHSPVKPYKFPEVKRRGTIFMIEESTQLSFEF